MKIINIIRNRITAAAVILMIAAVVFSMTGCSKNNSLKDGTYQIEVTMTGGSGRASVQSPAEMTVKNSETVVKLVWSSSNYDYMIVDDETYYPAEDEEYSTFSIPVTVFDEPITMIADTTAMSTTHEITYEFTFHSDTIQSSDSKEDSAAENADDNTANHTVNSTANDGQASAEKVRDRDKNISMELTYVSSMELFYATQFAVDYYKDDYCVITVASGDRYLLLPDNGKTPDDLSADITVISSKPKNIYLAATAAMDMFVSAEALDHLSFSSIKESFWQITEAKEAMQNGTITYAGKYAAPDYELLLEGGCDLCVESTMIYHTPEVKEKLESLGIPVLVDYASYENEPLGRSEWIKLYGVLTGSEEKANEAFEAEKQLYESVLGAVSDQKENQNADNTGTGENNTVVFFYITSGGKVNVRRPGEYLTKMTEDAGGDYFLSKEQDAGENASSTMSMDAESFYAAAKDADILIYNSTIEGEISSVDELLKKNPLIANIKAVQEGKIYCTSANLYQASMECGEILQDFYNVIHGDTNELTYLYVIN